MLGSVRSAHRYFAGPDDLRRADLQAALVGDYSAVFVVRGGFGAQRIVDDLDWAAIREAAPRHVVGFSDVTALHQALRVRVGWGSIHGPVVTRLGESSDAVLGRLRALLFEPTSVKDLFEGEMLVDGAAVGPLVGGNLKLLATGVGTADQGSAAGCIVALEDVTEAPPYRVDALVTQLLRSGWLDGARAVVLGGFTECGPLDELREVFVDRLEPLGVPVLWGASFGHIDENLAFPLGDEVTLTDGVLRLADPTAD